MSKAITAVPLFDRLSGVFPPSADGRLLDGVGLQHSLQLDLGRLFNVRNGLTVREFLDREPSVLHYGLPDTLSLSPNSEFDLQLWAEVLSHCIAAFEPRLSRVQVSVSADPDKAYGARASIAAAVTVGTQVCRVNFDVALDASSALLRVAA
ncbi:MAG TPA: type VI secretion system baseplate subunit TssE [Janthinobacterium sp.]|nr:type VI secretion system baseplate subunit TssE [Janthinobacterium sp.]